MTWAVLLLGAGLLLVLAEVLIPSMGVLGTLAAACIVGAQVFAWRVSSQTGVNFLLVTGVLVPAVVMGGLKLFPRTPVGKKLVAQGFSFEDGRAIDTRDSGLLGAEGVVEAMLRPAGVARLNGRRVDVVSRGEMIPKGARVQVVELTGNRVVVQPIQNDEGPA
ncbi:MAG: NfeD family protein [Planctomycetes bacterium]|nr:NfeD family protein [Planctomycetota bacterium]MCB9904836.1 NfeD family protein [Planctomycetota bacterium]